MAEGISKYDQIRNKMLEYQGHPKEEIMDMTIIGAISLQASSKFSTNPSDLEEDADPVSTETTKAKEIDVSETPQETGVKQIANTTNEEGKQSMDFSQQNLESTLHSVDENFYGPGQLLNNIMALRPEQSMDMFSSTFQRQNLPSLDRFPEHSNGPERMRSQRPIIEFKEERIDHLEADIRDLRERISKNDKVFQGHRKEIQRRSEKRDDDMNKMKKEVESLKVKMQALERENKLTRKSAVSPANLEEWLGCDWKHMNNVCMNDKLITYFSKPLMYDSLAITGSYFGFSDSEVRGILYDSNNSSRECCRMLLKRWCNKQGETATLGSLLQTFFKISKRESTCIDSKCLKEALKKAVNSSLFQ